MMTTATIAGRSPGESFRRGLGQCPSPFVPQEKERVSEAAVGPCRAEGAAADECGACLENGPTQRHRSRLRKNVDRLSRGGMEDEKPSDRQAATHAQFQVTDFGDGNDAISTAQKSLCGEFLMNCKLEVERGSFF